MNYCENCNCLVNGERCPACGKRKLREVGEKDFCYFVTLDNLKCSMFESALQENKIEVALIPRYTFGVSYFNAGRADSQRIFIHYENLPAAREIYERLFPDEKKK